MKFVETMRGWVRGADGVEHPIAFDVRASATERPGHFSLEGIVSAPPFAPEALATGTLVMSALPPSIAYHLRFESPAHGPLELVAAKHPRPWAPLRTMTLMEATLSSGAGVLARGPMRFLLADLPPFLASWLPVRTQAARRLDAGTRLLERRLLESP